MSVRRRGRRLKNPWALSGVFFVVLFIWGLILGGVLSSSPFPMPSTPTPEIARYYSENQAAVLASGSLQILSSLALLVFAFRVAAFVRRIAVQRGMPSGSVLTGGALAAALLMVSALLSWMLVLVAPGGLALIATLRDLNFITGGAAHVASLGVFVGATSIFSLRRKAFRRWVPWLGIVASALSFLSLASLAWFPATFLIPIGRLLSFVWTIAVSLSLVLGGQEDKADREG